MSTTTAIISQIGTTTGQLISDSYPIFIMILALFIGWWGYFFMISMVGKAYKKFK